MTSTSSTMTSTIRTRSAAHTAAAVALLAAGLGTAALGTTGAAGAAEAGPQRTTITFAVADCEGCEVQLHQALATEYPVDVEEWHSRTKTVTDGEVSFTVRSKRTQGMSATVRAPWEGHTGYVTTVAFRYGGEDLADRVTFKEARKKKKASACWEGTRRDEVTIPLVVRQVRVQGVHEEVDGSIAFVRKTQSWLDPMRRAPHGVLGSQDVNVCG